MDYPSRLLPKSHYKLLTNNQQLKKYYLLHFVDPGIPCKTAREIQRNISRIMVTTRYYSGMSCSLFCKIKIEDMRIKLNDPQGIYQSPWVAGMEGLQPSSRDVESINRRRVVAVKMSDLLSFRVKSHIGPDDKRESITIMLRPEHSPVRVNFWHINLFLDVHKDSDDSVVECKRDRTKRLAVAMSDDFAKIIHPASKRQKKYLTKSIYQ